MVAEAAAAIIRAVRGNAVSIECAASVRAALSDCSSVRLALADILPGHLFLTGDLLQSGPLTAALFERATSCCGLVLLSCKPFAADTRLQPGFRDLEAVTSGQPGHFFCVPIPRPAGAGGSLGALLLQFASGEQATLVYTDPRASLLLAAELSQRHGQVLLAHSASVAASLVPPGHGAEGPGWGLGVGGASGSGTTTGGTLTTSNGEESQQLPSSGVPSLLPSSPSGTNGTNGSGGTNGTNGSGGTKGSAEGEAERARRADAARLLAGMGRLTLRFRQRAEDAAYAAWRQAHLAQRDGRRLGTLLCCHLGLLFVFPALSLACTPSLALLGIPLVLRAVPVSQGWYQARRGAVVALVLCALVLHASAHVLPALRALPREAERERLLKAAHLWMLGVGWSLQVPYPRHAALLLAASAAWVPLLWQLCHELHPGEWLPGCLARFACYTLLFQLLLPGAAAYHAERAARRQWANSVWRGHLHHG